MKNKPNKPSRDPRENLGTQKNDPKQTAGDKTDTAKSASTEGDKWKHPDPTIPEREHNPDPTKPEKEEGPYSDKVQPKVAFQPKRNPAQAELNKDEDLGEFIERDIDEMGITGEEKEQEQDEDLEEEEEQIPPTIKQPMSKEQKNDQPEEQHRKSA